MIKPNQIELVDNFDYIPMCQEIDPMDFPKVKISATGGVRLNGSMENVEFLMEQYGITCKFNMITREEEVSIPASKFTADNEANSSINTVVNLCINNNIPTQHVVNHVKAIADRFAYNPVMDWIDSEEWDGKDRVSQVVKGVRVMKGYEEIKSIYLRKWFMCAVGMLENGTNGMNLDYEGILVFQGKQGVGKTSWFKGLVSRELRGLIRDGFELDLNSKDSRISFASHWMVELGELDATFKKSEISALKAFTTMSSDKVRRPYDRVDTTLFRRTVMFASVNDVQFLQDDTGNRRFWCLPVESLSLPENFNQQQFWAQVKNELNNAGGSRAKPWFVVGGDANKRDEANEMFTASDPVEEKILSFFDKGERMKLQATATMVAEFTGLSVNKASTNAISKYLRKHFGEAKRLSGGRFFTLPKPRQSNSEILQRIGFKKV